MTYRVLLCDDNPKVCADWVEAVSGVAPPEHYEVLKPHANGEVREACREIFARQSAELGEGGRERNPCLFDDADILVLDYDLLYIDECNARHTGEALARLARTFSSPEVVVVVNQFPEAHFDLSLRGHLESHADLNLRADLLGTPGLWTDPPWTGFRPWHWQTLHRAVETQRARRKLVEEHFEDSIFDVLGFEEEDYLRLSDTTVGFIAPDAREWSDVRERTFKSFALSLANGRCASAHFESDREAACRFAAARIGKWLERRILGPQDPLVDLPHLIERFPFLLGDGLAEPAAWKAAVLDGEHVKSLVPEGCWFEPADILSRPAVWSRHLLEQPGFRDRRDSFDYSRVPPLAFLEDTSTFEPLDDVSQFRAGHNNFHDLRFAKCVARKVYAPQRRLAFVG